MWNDIEGKVNSLLAIAGKYGIIEDVYIFGAPLLVPRVLPSQQPSTKPETASSKGKASSSTPPPVDYTLPQHMQSLDEWRKAVSVVSGTLVNCFTRTDWVLGYLFRGSVAGMYDVAGLNPVVLDEEETPDVEILQADEFAPKDASVDPEHGATYKTISEEDRERKLRERPRTVRNIDISELVPGHSHYRNAMPMLVKRVCGFATWTESVEVIEEVVMGEWMEDVDGRLHTIGGSSMCITQFINDHMHNRLVENGKRTSQSCAHP